MSNNTSVTLSEDRNIAADKQHQIDVGQEMVDTLIKLGGGTRTSDNSVMYIEGTAIGLPTTPSPMAKKVAAKQLANAAAEDEEEFAFTHEFNFRPWDGAYATQQVLREVFGVAATGAATYSFFGKNPPELRAVNVGPGEKVDVPWGLLKLVFPTGDDIELTLGGGMSRKYGLIFQITINAPKKLQSAMRGLCKMIEMKLQAQSIYKNKAIIFDSTDPWAQFEFLDVAKIKPEAVAYSQDVFELLEYSLWGRIRTAEAHRNANIPLNKKVLLEGPYGTGKSLAGELTAKVCNENGWTFIQSQAGNMNLENVMQVARIYSPAVVFIEDVEKYMQQGNTQQERDAKLSQLLELFDGISAKNSEVAVVMTTNHLDQFEDGMTRAGRIDTIVHIGDLDVEGIRRLLNYLYDPSQLADDLDFEAICAAMEGFTPAFIKTTLENTKSSAIVRTGEVDSVLTTEDFVAAAVQMKPHNDRHKTGKGEKEDGYSVLGKALVPLFEPMIVDAVKKVAPSILAPGCSSHEPLQVAEQQ